MLLRTVELCVLAINIEDLIVNFKEIHKEKKVSFVRSTPPIPDLKIEESGTSPNVSFKVSWSEKCEISNLQSQSK